MALARIIMFMILLWALSSRGVADELSHMSERTRAAQAMQLHLMAADLLDELVYQWTRQAPLPGAPQKVVLMRLSTPLGLNQQLSSFLENHFYNLLLKNPQTGLVMTYCGSCLELTSYSSSRQTLLAQGAAIPEILEIAKQEAPYGLYLDLEASGSELHLRAYLTDFAQNQIVATKSLVTNSSHPPLLRVAKRLSSVEDTRQEYIEILQGRRRWHLLAGLRANILKTTSSNITALPFVWGQVGVEAMSDAARKWMADFQLGFASLPGEYNAQQVSSRIYRLWDHETIDLIAPNIFGFIGFGYWNIDGNSALFFENNDALSPGVIAARSLLKESRPRSQNVSLTLGLEVRLTELFRFGLFAESFLNQDSNKNFTDTIDSYGIDFGVIL